MKELSIEEKAKCYDEAIERAKNFIENGDERERTIAESIFAGIMEESEDERMLNQLHSWMKEFGGAEEYTERVYYWLKGLIEKQGEQKSYASETMNEKGDFDNGFTRMMEKEQKPADEELKKLLRAEYEKGRAKGKAQTLCEMPKEIDSQVWKIANNAAITWEHSFAVLMAAKNAYDKGKADAIVQTPAWSEEDDNFIKSIIAALSIFAEEKKANGCFDNEINWLKSIKDRVQLQPKQKWGEDDEQYLLICKNALTKYQTTDKWDAHIIFNWLENKLKSIIPMNNSVEWSMEDEEELEIALDTLKKAGQYSSAEWLKNVCLVPQSHWKPSEEQMKALDSAIHCYAGISPTNNREVFALEIMKEQLKKLREE